MTSKINEIDIMLNNLWDNYKVQPTALFITKEGFVDIMMNQGHTEKEAIEEWDKIPFED